MDQPNAATPEPQTPTAAPAQPEATPEPPKVWVQAITDRGPWRDNRKMARGERVQVPSGDAEYLVEQGLCRYVPA